MSELNQGYNIVGLSQVNLFFATVTLLSFCVLSFFAINVVTLLICPLMFLDQVKFSLRIL